MQLYPSLYFCCYKKVVEYYPMHFSYACSKSNRIGLADPNALTQAVAAFQGCQFLGMPECEVCKNSDIFQY